MATIYPYEVSNVGAERIWDVPYARLEDATPEVGHAAALISILPGTQICGVVKVIDPAASRAVIDFTPAKIYSFSVRNVITYSGAAESTFAAVNIGDPVYYDGGATMVALGLELSTSPLDAAGVANPLFGFVVGKDETDTALYPKGTTTASTQSVGVIVRGAGA